MSTIDKVEHVNKQGHLLKISMCTYDKKQMFGFVKSNIKIPYLYKGHKDFKIASEEEVEKYGNVERNVDENGDTENPFIFYPKKRFVYLMYRNKPRLYIETRDIKDGKASPLYYKQINIKWNLTDKDFIKYGIPKDEKEKQPVLTIACKEKQTVASIFPGTRFFVTSNGKIIREKFDTKGKIIINDRKKKYPYDW